MNSIDRLAERLFERVQESHSCVDNRDPARAESIMNAMLAEAEPAGLRSANAWWVLAIAHDNQGELEPAFEAIVKAVAYDPLEPGVRNSRDIIVRRIGEALAAPDRAGEDPSTPRLYRLLQRNGTVSLAAHLAMVRHHLATGAIAEARKLAEAVTLAFPVEPDGWRAKARVLQLQGDAAGARAAEAQAAAVAPSPDPFGIPGAAEA